jgi:hypothetical protein
MSLDSRGPALVWCLLCALTVTSISFAAAEGWRELAWTAIVLTAATKARLVIVHYMEVGHAASHWRMLYAAWTVAAAATIIIGLSMGSAA